MNRDDTVGSSAKNDACAKRKHCTHTNSGGDDDDEGNPSSTSGAVLGGSMRTAVLFFAKRMSIKSMLRKRAFLLIGGTADGGAVDSNKSVVTRRRPNIAFSHSRPVVYMEATMMGMMVFGTYDILIYWYNLVKSKVSERERTDVPTSTFPYDDIGGLIDRTPDVVVHTIAGGAAGVARTLFWMGWEAGVHRNFWVLDHPKFCIRNTVHHAVGYGALFGTFQFTRQALLFLDPLSMMLAKMTKTYSPIIHTDTTISKDDNNNFDFYNTEHAVPMTYTTLAGGMAGQTHHIVQHYTSHWKQFAVKVPPPPRLHPTMTSFGTMSLCFLAFEHGPQIVDGWTEEIIEALHNVMKKYTS